MKYDSLMIEALYGQLPSYSSAELASHLCLWLGKHLKPEYEVKVVQKKMGIAISINCNDGTYRTLFVARWAVGIPHDIVGADGMKKTIWDDVYAMFEVRNYLRGLLK